VTPQQLQSQQGMVRCGRCATVFDGFKALATLPEDAQPEPAPRVATSLPVVISPQPLPAAEPAPVTPEHVEAAVEAAQSVETVPTETVARQEIDAQEPASEFETEHASEREPGLDRAPEDESAADPAPVPHGLVAEPAMAEPALEPIGAAAPPLRRRTAVWAFGSLVLLVGLAAQFVYLYRGDIAATLPEARPYLTDWCKSLHCTVALPQQPRQISIEASDMQAADTANPGLVILTATLRNQATTTLGYPALDVVLTNTREHTVARRIFLPAEYLADSKDWRAGMAPSAEVTIRLNIDSGDLGAAGFRLDLMAAPAT
jgi:hypothetical protein